MRVAAEVLEFRLKVQVALEGLLAAVVAKAAAVVSPTMVA
jgi:hypothetical protein